VGRRSSRTRAADVTSPTKAVAEAFARAIERDDQVRDPKAYPPISSKATSWDGPNAVFMVDADGTNARLITPWSVTLRAAWSPDGEWIAYDMSASIAAPRDLFVVHPDGTERTDITSSDNSKLSWAPAWWPDNAKVLFVRFGSDGRTRTCGP
jgi:Tol biopolymer transport system component